MANPAPTVNLKMGYNGLPPPKQELPLPDKPEVITSNVLTLNESISNPRNKFLFDKLVKHMHDFVQETQLTNEEWINSIHFLTRVGQTCTDVRQEFILLSDVLGVSALVDAINHPPIEGATDSTVLGPFFTEDAPDVAFGDSIASEGKGDYLFVEGRILSTDGKPVVGAVMETWETDGDGTYDTQYEDRDHPDCRGRLRSDSDGRYSFRAIVPVSYPIPNDGPVGELLATLGRHNMRPSHLHIMITAPGFRSLTTSLYPEGDAWLTSDVVFGTKKSLIVGLKTIQDESEAKKRGFPTEKPFKLLNFDFFLLPEEKQKSA